MSRDVVCDITCTTCTEPVRVGSRDLEKNVMDNGRYTCWTCQVGMEDE